MFGCILYSVHVQNDCNCVCVCVCVLGMLLCACADCMVWCVHVLAAWFCVCMLTAWLCVLVHPCVPTDCPVHVHMMHAYHVQAGCHIKIYYVHMFWNNLFKILFFSCVQVQVLSKSSHRN